MPNAPRFSGVYLTPQARMFLERGSRELGSNQGNGSASTSNVPTAARQREQTANAEQGGGIAINPELESRQHEISNEDHGVGSASASNDSIQARQSEQTSSNETQVFYGIFAPPKGVLRPHHPCFLKEKPLQPGCYRVEDCAICLQTNSLAKGKGAVVVCGTCLKAMHVECVVQLRGNCCPSCRTQIFKHPPYWDVPVQQRAELDLRVCFQAFCNWADVATTSQLAAFCKLRITALSEKWARLKEKSQWMQTRELELNRLTDFSNNKIREANENLIKIERREYQADILHESATKSMADASTALEDARLQITTARDYFDKATKLQENACKLREINDKTFREAMEARAYAELLFEHAASKRAHATFMLAGACAISFLMLVWLSCHSILFTDVLADMAITSFFFVADFLFTNVGIFLWLCGVICTFVHLHGIIFEDDDCLVCSLKRFYESTFAKPSPVTNHVEQQQPIVDGVLIITDDVHTPDAAPAYDAATTNMNDYVPDEIANVNDCAPEDIPVDEHSSEDFPVDEQSPERTPPVHAYQSIVEQSIDEYQSNFGRDENTFFN